MLSGNISKVSLEYYKASTLANYLHHPNIQLERIETIKGSYGVLIGGEAKRIKHCVSRHAKEREQEILEKVDKLVYRYEVMFLDSLCQLASYQSCPQSEFVALPLRWDTRGRSAI